MIETLTLDYRKGGSSELFLGEPIDESISRSVLDAARLALIERGENDALAFVDARDFTLYSSTNGFDDAFLTVLAWVSPERLAEYRRILGRPVSDGQRTALERAAAALRDAVGASSQDQREVRFVAVARADNVVRGRHGEYRFEEEFDRGGFATIHRATTEAGEIVALKRLYVRDEEAIARLRREIQEQQRIDHPSVMRIVDHDPAFRWFVMPLADENLAQRWADDRLDQATLIQVLRAAITGLGAAHSFGLVHRDVSPRNILRIRDTWVVADWGVVRRPRGLTTMVRTQGELGTNGFAAPELFRDAHEAGASADVYALGRIAAWAVIRQWPEQNVPLLPAGPWRHFVRLTTEHDADRRPQSMGDLAALLEQVEAELQGHSGRESPLPRFLTESLDDPAVAEECFEHCAAHPDDYDVFLDVLPLVDQTRIDVWQADRPAELERLVGAMQSHVLNDAVWARRNVDSSNQPIAWLRSVARAAAAASNEGLLEDATVALMRTEAKWQRFPQRHQTRAWLEGLSGPEARTVARVLVRDPAAVEWLTDEGWSPARTAPDLRAALVRRQRR